MTRSSEAGFWARVSRRPGDGCWIWTGAGSGPGYGGLKFQGRRLMAHRLAWELEHGAPPPADMEVAHRCDERRCVRPDHLFLATHAENIADREAKGRSAKGDTHGSRKVDSVVVVKMREMREQTGASYERLATAFGVSAIQASRIVRGENWASVPEGLAASKVRARRRAS